MPMAMTTDVNAAARELRYGRAAACSLVYITIGTGIGGGAIIRGRLLQAGQHPEMGHMLLPQSTGPGVCPYHRNCWEDWLPVPVCKPDPESPRRTSPMMTQRGSSRRRSCHGAAQHHVHTRAAADHHRRWSGQSKGAARTFARTARRIPGRLLALALTAGSRTRW